MQTKFLPFEEAREFVRKLGLKNQEEWVAYRGGKMPEKGQRPSNIPSAPEATYKRTGWAGTRDWLGLPPSRFIPYADASALAKSMGIRTERQWVAYAKSLSCQNVPVVPSTAYRGQGWVNWYEFLGTPPLKGRYWPFKKARAYARKLRLKRVYGPNSWEEFRRSGARPPQLPSSPADIYRGEWTSWPDFMNSSQTAHRHKGIWETYSYARRFARKLGLVTKPQWRAYCRGRLAETHGIRPDHIPSNPDQVYKRCGWRGYPDFLRGPQTKARYLSFNEARRLVRSLGIKTLREYDAYRLKTYTRADRMKLPSILSYYKQYRGRNHFFGMRFASFEIAREFVRKIGLRSVREWKDYSAGRLEATHGVRPSWIRGHIHLYRGHGWAGIADFLGFTDSGSGTPADSLSVVNHGTHPALDLSPPTLEASVTSS